MNARWRNGTPVKVGQKFVAGEIEYNKFLRGERNNVSIYQVTRLPPNDDGYVPVILINEVDHREYLCGKRDFEFYYLIDSSSCKRHSGFKSFVKRIEGKK